MLMKKAFWTMLSFLECLVFKERRGSGHTKGFVRQRGYWKYEIVHDYNATRLIKEFREENLQLKNSKGTEDDELDFIMYAEKDDFTISLGRVLLIKMSDAMVKYHYEYKGTEDLPTFWASYIYKQSYDVKTFHFTEDEIANAFVESVRLQSPDFLQASVLDIINTVKKITDHFSAFLHEDLLLTREHWDPTLKSDKYLLSQQEDIAKLFIDKCDKLISRLKKYHKDLELLQSYKVLAPVKEQVAKIVKIVESYIKSITVLKEWFIQSKELAKLGLPFYCGVWNGLIQFIAAIVDVVLLAINVLINDELSDLVGSKTNLELMEVEEGVEEILNAVLEDPAKIFNSAINEIENYQQTRYSDPKLNDYQISHNSGEDLILAIDLVTAVVTVVKGVVQLGKLLPKFTKWFDEVLARGGKGARKVGNALIKLRKVAYGESELSKIAIQFRKTLPKPRHGGNVAVFEYLDDMGKIKRKEFTTIKGNKDHAEMLGMKWLREEGIADDKVVKIYSELEPCSLERHNCKQKLQRYKNAEQEYSYDYPGIDRAEAEIRRNSIKERSNDFKKLIK